MTKSEVKVLLDRSKLLEEEVEIYKEQYRELKEKGKDTTFQVAELSALGVKQQEIDHICCLLTGKYLLYFREEGLDSLDQ